MLKQRFYSGDAPVLVAYDNKILVEYDGEHAAMKRICHNKFAYSNGYEPMLQGWVNALGNRGMPIVNARMDSE